MGKFQQPYICSTLCIPGTPREYLSHNGTSNKLSHILLGNPTRVSRQGSNEMWEQEMRNTFKAALVLALKQLDSSFSDDQVQLFVETLWHEIPALNSLVQSVCLKALTLAMNSTPPAHQPSTLTALIEPVVSFVSENSVLDSLFKSPGTSCKTNL